MGYPEAQYAVDELTPSLNKLLERLGIDDATTLVSILEALRTFMSTGNIPIVKSVQRGTTTATSVTISSVNPAKCLVITNGELHSGGVDAYQASGRNGTYTELSTTTNQNGICTALTATKLTLTQNKVTSSGSYDTFDGWSWNYVTGKVSWQVIEFY